MKSLLIAAIAFFSVHIVSAQQNDFRHGNWGASFYDIMAIDTSTLVMNIGQSELIYKDELAGAPCEAYYMFTTNDQLVSGRYIFTKQYVNPQGYVLLYDKFLNMLAGKYGEPDGEAQTWHPSFRELDRDAFGREIAQGNLSLSTSWATKTAMVTLSLDKGFRRATCGADSLLREILRGYGAERKQ